MGDVPEQALGFRVQLYRMDEYHKLFTPRQLTALTTFSDLVHEARDLATQDAREAGLADDDVPLRDGGRGARAYGEAVSVYLAFAVDKAADFWSKLVNWINVVEAITHVFSRQVLTMVWDFPEANPFSAKCANWMACVERVLGCLDSLPTDIPGYAEQIDARKLSEHAKTLSTDPP